MNVSARAIHAGVTAAALAAYLVLGAVQGELSGFSFPFDLGVWAIAFGLAGWIITGADPTQGVGRCMSWAGTLAAIYGLFGQTLGIWGDEMLAAAERSPVLATVALLLGQIYVVVMWLVVTAIAIFPDGHYPSRVARWTHGVFTVAAFVQALLWASEPSDDAVLSVDLPVLADNPLLQSVTSPALGLSALLLVAMSLVGAIRGGPVRRRQLGWAALGAVGLVALSGLAGALPAGVGDAVGMLGFVAFPAGIVLAVTKYKLYEIDRLVSRTVTYAVVIAVLVGVYFGLVLLLRSLLPVEGPLPVALSTLAVAFAFLPLARRVQGIVDRRFFRSRYDAAEVVASFASELRGTIDTAGVVDRAERVVDDVFAPESVGVWVAGRPG